MGYGRSGGMGQGAKVYISSNWGYYEFHRLPSDSFVRMVRWSHPQLWDQHQNYRVWVAGLDVLVGSKSIYGPGRCRTGLGERFATRYIWVTSDIHILIPVSLSQFVFHKRWVYGIPYGIYSGQ